MLPLRFHLSFETISCEGLSSTNVSPRHGIRAAAAAASAGRSDRHGSADQGEVKDSITEAGGGQTNRQAEVISDADGDDVGDDVTRLRELTQQQEEDLRTAAIIGQKLLDTQEELHAELEVGEQCRYISSHCCVLCVVCCVCFSHLN